MRLTFLVPVIFGLLLAVVHYNYPNAFSFLKFAFNSVGRDIKNTSNDKRELRCLDFVKTRAKRGDAVSVLNEIDKFGWTEDFLMNVGDAKGEILSTALKQKGPTHVLEVGAYIGYSATLISSNLLPEAHLTSVEFSNINAAIAREIV